MKKLFFILLCSLLLVTRAWGQSPFKNPYFVTSLGFNLAASAVDWADSHHALNNGAVDLNFVIGSRGQRLNYVKGITMGVSTLSSYYGWKKAERERSRRQKAAIVIANFAVGAIYTAVVIGNHRH